MTQNKISRPESGIGTFDDIPDRLSRQRLSQRQWGGKPEIAIHQPTHIGVDR